jgi:putative peptidoglycan lipid II flippase
MAIKPVANHFAPIEQKTVIHRFDSFAFKNMKQTIQLGLLSAANIVMTFLLQWYVLIQLGTGTETDALFAGMTIPQIVLVVISGSLTHVLVPILAGENVVRQQQEAWSLIFFVGGLFGFIAILLYVTASLWIPITVPGFDEAGKALTVELTRIQLLGMIFTAINGVQISVYHARQQFVWAELFPIVSSIIVFPFLIWALPLYGVVVAVWISTLRVVLQTFLLGYGMGKPVCPDLKSAAIKQVWLRIKPLLLGTSYYKTDTLVDRFLLSTAGSGSLSLYFLAQQMYGSFSHVLDKAIAAPVVPILSKLYKLRNKEDFIKVYDRKLKQMGMISLASLFIFALVGQDILSFLVGHGNINAKNISDLWWIMIWLGGMFVGGVAGQITSSAFYASGDTKTPTRIGIYTFTFYIPLKILLFYFFGVKGLAIITSIFVLINLFFQNHLLKSNGTKF